MRCNTHAAKLLSCPCRDVHVELLRLPGTVSPCWQPLEAQRPARLHPNKHTPRFAEDIGNEAFLETRLGPLALSEASPKPKDLSWVEAQQLPRTRAGRAPLAVRPGSAPGYILVRQRSGSSASSRLSLLMVAVSSVLSAGANGMEAATVSTRCREPLEARTLEAVTELLSKGFRQ